MRIGLTIFPSAGSISWWSNGAHQNIAALWLCLRASGNDVVLINGGEPDGNLGAMPPEFAAMQLARMPDVVDSLDVLIEGGAQIAAADAARVHARGGKVVALRFGHSLCIDAERAVHNLPAGGIFNGTQFDAVWTTRQHEDTCGTYWETLHRCPVRVLPHIWTSAFVDWTIARFPADLAPRYVPGRAKKRVAICEPNINLIKTAHIPMLIAERAYRQSQSLIDRVLVTNAIQLRDRLPFATFAKALDITHAKADDGGPVCSFEPRYSTPWFLAAHADILVSHQWVETPTYLHYDALHMRYPLVHNADRNMPGYYYDGFNCEHGMWALLKAMGTHDKPERLAQYDAACARFLRTVDATEASNVEAHARAVEELFS